MVVLGLLLLIVAAAALIDIALASNGTTSLHVLGWHISQVRTGGTLLIGAAIGAAIVLGLVAIMYGLRRGRRRKLSQRQALALQQEENQRLADELRAQQERAVADNGDEPAVRTVPATVPTGVVQQPDPYPTDGYPADGAGTVKSPPPAPPPNESVAAGSQPSRGRWRR
jgi:hypothetical protein